MANEAACWPLQVANKTAAFQLDANPDHISDAESGPLNRDSVLQKDVHYFPKRKKERKTCII
jgi:hypothetical protein